MITLMLKPKTHSYCFLNDSYNKRIILNGTIPITFRGYFEDLIGKPKKGKYYIPYEKVTPIEYDGKVLIKSTGDSISFLPAREKPFACINLKVKKTDNFQMQSHLDIYTNNMSGHVGGFYILDKYIKHLDLWSRLDDLGIRIFYHYPKDDVVFIDFGKFFMVNDKIAYVQIRDRSVSIDLSLEFQ